MTPQLRPPTPKASKAHKPNALADAIHQIRRSAAGNAAMLESLLRSLEVLSSRTAIPTRRAALRQHAEAIARTVRSTVPDPEDHEQLEARANLLLETLAQNSESAS